MFYTLVKSYSSLNITLISSHEQCIDDMKGEMMLQDQYDHMVKLWNTFDIKTWGEYYELYKVFDVTLMANTNCTKYSMWLLWPMHLNTSEIPHSMHSVLIPCICITKLQRAYSLFLKVTIEGDHGERNLRFLGEKWAQYITRISTNEGLTEKQLEKIFMRSSWFAWTNSMETMAFDW